jgi:hypothetical protein
MYKSFIYYKEEEKPPPPLHFKNLGHFIIQNILKGAHFMVQLFFIFRMALLKVQAEQPH